MQRKERQLRRRLGPITRLVRSHQNMSRHEKKEA
jgi:hypothetical protein